jgi:hypothetical protein
VQLVQLEQLVQPVLQDQLEHRVLQVYQLLDQLVLQALQVQQDQPVQLVQQVLMD